MIYLNGAPLPNLPEISFLKVNIGYNWTRLKIKKVSVDVGQQTAKNHLITNENGENLVFNSDIDVINYISKEGFDLIQIVPTANENGIPALDIYFRKIK